MRREQRGVLPGLWPDDDGREGRSAGSGAGRGGAGAVVRPRAGGGLPGGGRVREPGRAEAIRRHVRFGRGRGVLYVGLRPGAGARGESGRREGNSVPGKVVQWRIWPCMQCPQSDDGAALSGEARRLRVTRFWTAALWFFTVAMAGPIPAKPQK